MKNKLAKRASSIIIILVSIMITCSFASGLLRIHVKRNVSSEARDFINNLGTGYNIGNALDVCDWNSKFQDNYGVDTQTLWWGTLTTEDFVKMLSDEGFGVIRLPVTYMNHIDEDGNIDPAWLAKVEELAGWVIKYDMYCIVDIHHDTGNDGWIKASKANYEQNSSRAANMITQIAETFKDYDDHLILESFNEMVDDKNHWTRVPYSSLKAFNKWNQLFVNTVRSTGGNNSSRYLLVNTYAATYNKLNLYYFEMPNDSAQNRLIAGVHNYTGPDGLEKSFESIKMLSDRGYPVIIGEFGSKASASYDRAEHAAKFVALSKEYGFCPIWWDNNENPQKHKDTSFSVYDREKCVSYFSEITKALTSDR